MSLPITSILAICLVLIALPLTIHISMRRALIGMKTGVIDKAVFSDTGDAMLRNSVRAFGNFIEYVPLALLLFALIEIQGASAQLIWWTGGAFVGGRFVHALSMTFIPNNPMPRGLAMITTYTAYILPAWWLFTQAF